jgi:nitroimidazol reductase NimA-like FMN-containing flavoprotein (pyridoxamine 5'-phosphate oxidase superfamily)/GNAT superfamily N-acetyltransferase
MTKLAPTPRSQVKRRARRGSHDLELIESILDEALIAHVGVHTPGGVVVLPMTYARIAETLYLHGAVSNELLRAATSGSPVCLTVTLLDGLVLARSAFHHSMNYRSVVLFGLGRDVTGAAEKRRALSAIVERMAPGRSMEARAPTEPELAATRVIALAIREGSAKVRRGPPVDDAEDLQHDVWAGVIPLRLAAGPLEPAPEMPPDRRASAAVRNRALGSGARARCEAHGELLVTDDLSRVDLDSVYRHLSDTYWAADRAWATFERAVQNSLCVAVIRPEASDELVGFARVVGDRATFAYVMDVFVVESQRRRGVARAMMQFLRSHSELSGVRRWMLGTRDAHELYERLGFRPTLHPERWMELVIG